VTSFIFEAEHLIDEALFDRMTVQIEFSGNKHAVPLKKQLNDEPS